MAPKAIETEEENDKALAVIEKLMAKGDARSPEENLLLELLTVLVERFEESAYPPVADRSSARIDATQHTSTD